MKPYPADHAAVVCSRLGDPHYLHVRGSTTEKCTTCDNSVMVSPATRATARRFSKYAIVCVECWAELTAKNQPVTLPDNESMAQERQATGQLPHTGNALLLTTIRKRTNFFRVRVRGVVLLVSQEEFPPGVTIHVSDGLAIETPDGQIYPATIQGIERSTGLDMQSKSGLVLGGFDYDQIPDDSKVFVGVPSHSSAG
jgi:hypothetical protein